MSLYAFTSASGAPGVSTAAIAWAYLATRPTLLLEVDTKGGSDILAGVWQGQQQHEHSILDLTQALPEDLHEQLIDSAYALPNTTDAWVLPTIGRPVQANALTNLWPDVLAAARTLSDRGMDIIVDLGRLNTVHLPRVLLTQADAVVLFTDSTLPALNNAAITTTAVREQLAQSGSGERLTVAAVTGGKDAAHLRPYSAGEIADLLKPTVLVGDLPYDPRSAAVYSLSQPPQRSWLTRPYNSAVRAFMDALRSHGETVSQNLAGRKSR